jgi:hypothetical protein
MDHLDLSRVMSIQSTSLAFFDAYVKAGFKPIAVYDGTKVPIGESWNCDWSVQRWRPFFEQGNRGIGILLGDVIDVEGDSDDANDLLSRMIDGAKRPMYRSSKSIHNIFQNDCPSLTRIVVGGIEFRAHTHMSVVPPSKHTDGSIYKWLEGTKFPVPQMPEELKNFLLKHLSARANKTGRPRSGKGRRLLPPNHRFTRCNSCGAKCPISTTRLKLEVRAFRTMNRLWSCRSCRGCDIRELCRQLRKEGF